MDAERRAPGTQKLNNRHVEMQATTEKETHTRTQRRKLFCSQDNNSFQVVLKVQSLN